METKKVFKLFTIFEHEKEQAYLREMHKSGWKLTGVTGIGTYHFKKCNPEDVIYQLDYNQEGLANKEEYVQMFHDCGWEYLQDFYGYSYFRKPASETDGAEEIFCDDNSRMEMLDRVFKGRLVPLLAIFSCILIPCFCMYLDSNRYRIAAAIGVVIALYVGIFIGFALQYWKYKGKRKISQK